MKRRHSWQSVRCVRRLVALLLVGESTRMLEIPAALPTVGLLVRTRGCDWAALARDRTQVVRLRAFTCSEHDANGLCWLLYMPMML